MIDWAFFVVLGYQETDAGMSSEYSVTYIRLSSELSMEDFICVVFRGLWIRKAMCINRESIYRKILIIRRLWQGRKSFSFNPKIFSINQALDSALCGSNCAGNHEGRRVENRDESFWMLFFHIFCTFRILMQESWCEMSLQIGTFRFFSRWMKSRP